MELQLTWMATAERLPDHGGPYWIATTKPALEMAYRGTYSWYGYSNGDDVWDADDVTHWMDINLPELPTK